MNTRTQNASSYNEESESSPVFLASSKARDDDAIMATNSAATSTTATIAAATAANKVEEKERIARDAALDSHRDSVLSGSDDADSNGIGLEAFILKYFENTKDKNGKEPHSKDVVENTKILDLTMADEETGKNYIGNYWGTTRSGKAHGWGKWKNHEVTETCVEEYVGQWVENKPQGSGVFYFGNGSRYEVTVLPGKSPRGTFVDTDGNRKRNSSGRSKGKPADHTCFQKWCQSVNI